MQSMVPIVQKLFRQFTNTYERVGKFTNMSVYFLSIGTMLRIVP
jgi:hypothetical protein